jgi:hypothetical protein
LLLARVSTSVSVRAESRGIARTSGDSCVTAATGLRSRPRIRKKMAGFPRGEESGEEGRQKLLPPGLLGQVLTHVSRLPVHGIKASGRQPNG